MTITTLTKMCSFYKYFKFNINKNTINYSNTSQKNISSGIIPVSSPDVFATTVTGSEFPITGLKSHSGPKRP